jgi:cytochrome c553
MFQFVVLGLLVASPILAGDREGPVSPITLYVDYQHEIPDSIQRTIQREVAGIISPTGLTVEWRSLSAVYGSVNISLAVIHFQGNCNVTDLSVYPAYPFTLGSTAVSDGEVLPFSNIYCNAIRAYLSPQLRSIAPENRAVSFGRAVGRVVAHELYHIFAHTKHHSSHGLAEAALGIRELTAETFRFNRKEMQRLRTLMMPVLLEASEPIGKPLVNAQKAAFIRSGCLGCHGADGNGTQWGPSLHSARKSYDFTRLRFRLTDTQTLMYRRAEELGVLWPSLTDSDVSDLAGFFKNGVN